MKVSPKVSAQKGMTLVEIVVSLALLSIVLVMLASVYGASIHMIKRNGEDKIDSKHASSGVENAIGGYESDPETSEIEESSGEFSINFGGTTVKANGTYIGGSDENGGNQFHYFKPNED